VQANVQFPLTRTWLALTAPIEHFTGWQRRSDYRLILSELQINEKDHKCQRSPNHHRGAQGMSEENGLSIDLWNSTVRAAG
jgi:hypothetical protein